MALRTGLLHAALLSLAISQAIIAAADDGSTHVVTPPPTAPVMQGPPATDTPLLPDMDTEPPDEGPNVWDAIVVRGVKPIRGLLFDPLKIAVKVNDGGPLRTYVTVRGSFRRPGWTLKVNSVTLVDDKAAKRRRAHPFELKVYFTTKFSKFEFVSSRGNKTSHETVILTTQVPDALGERFVRAPTPWRLNLGISQMLYAQSDFGSYRASTLHFNAEYFKPKLLQTNNRWGLRANVAVDAAPIMAEPDYSPSIIHLQASALWSPPHWQHQAPSTPRASTAREGPTMRGRLHLGAGLDYATMLSGGSPFGFANLLVPSLELFERLVWRGGHSLELLGRISLLENNPLRIILLQQRGFEARVSYSFEFKNLPRAAIQLRYLDWKYFPDQATTIQLRSLSLAAGFQI